MTKSVEKKLSKIEMLLEYVKSRKAEINNSQLLQAEPVYLLFAGDECPIKYDAEEDKWHVWEENGTLVARQWPC